MSEGKKTILAVDAALGPCSVAVLYDNEIVAFLREDRPQMQARLLVPMIERSMREANLGYAELDAVVSTVGPGSFTGIRIGLAAARGIGFAAGKKVFGVTTLACVALLAATEKVLSVLDAGKGEVYFQPFALHPILTPLAAPAVGMLEAAQRLADDSIAGMLRSAADIPGFISVSPDASAAARLGAKGRPELLMPPEPLYIRPPDAKLPK